MYVGTPPPGFYKANVLDCDGYHGRLELLGCREWARGAYRHAVGKSTPCAIQGTRNQPRFLHTCQPKLR